MTRVALIDVLDRANADDCENIGQASIAATLRLQGCQVRLFSLVTEECASVDLARIGCHDLYGFSLYPNTVASVFGLAERLKQAFRDAFVCVGGQLATAAVTDILRDCASIDACILGEGEGSMISLVAALEAGSGFGALPAIRTRALSSAAYRPTTGGVDRDIWPARDLLPESVRRGNPTARINTSRGCVASCEFCSVNGFQVPRPAGASAAEPRPRPRWRGRGMDDVCREVLWIAREYRIRSFVFNDASFEDPGAYGRTRVAEFCDTIARSGLSFAFRCSMRAETVARHGRELLPMMRRCGFTNVFIGIESGSDADLHAFAKLASSSENDAALDAARECDVDVTMGYIMFHPGSTMEDLQRSCRSLIRWGGDKVGYFTRAVDVYFGTPLHRRLSREGLLTAEFSYANPLGYRFACEEVGAISRGLDVVRQHPVVGTLDGRLYHLGYTMSALRALFPDAAGTFVERFSQIRQDVAAMAAEFFEPMFGGNTRSIGDARVQAFLRACERMNADLARLGSRILFAKAFASFFAGEVDRLLRRVGTTSAVC